MITLPRTDELTPARARIAARLESEYESYTEQLAALLARRSSQSARTARRRGADTLHVARTDAARRGIADCAAALRRLAEGVYGRCEHCLGDIPLEELELNPAAHCCHGCETLQAG